MNGVEDKVAMYHHQGCLRCVGWAIACAATWMTAPLSAVVVSTTTGNINPPLDDPGWSHTDSPERVSNLGGSFGAFFADVTLHLFGYMAYALPALVIVAGWRIYRGRGRNLGNPLLRRGLATVGALLILTGGCGLRRHSPGLALSFRSS